MSVREVTLKLGPGQFAVVISDELASHYRMWSDPVQVMAEPSRTGDPDVVDLSFRQYECPEQHL